MAERKILNETYKCQPLPAREAIELLADLARIACLGVPRLPGVVDILRERSAPDADVGEMDNLLNVAGMAVIGDVLAQQRSQDLLAVLERVVTTAEIKRPSGYDPVSFDDDFTGSLGALLPVAGFVLEVNYAELLKPLVKSGLAKALRSAAA